MDPMLIFSILFGTAVIIGTLIAFFVRNGRLNRKMAILDSIRECLPEASVRAVSDQPYQFLIESAHRVYVVKLLLLSPQSELIVTNPDFWCVNSDPRSWSRSTAPVLIPGVKAFRDCRIDSTKETIKIGLIYPDCFNVSRYLNESEVELVKPTTDVNGVRLVRFPVLASFFAKVEKK